MKIAGYNPKQTRTDLTPPQTRKNTAMSEAKVKWSWEADYLQACNCDYGCPCEFSAPPTRGFCDGTGAWKIISGRYGDISLDGLGIGFAAHWPKAIHEGATATHRPPPYLLRAGRWIAL
jgi:hypothetical protein